MAGGWNSRPFVPPLSPSRNPSRRSPDPGPGTSPSSHQENNNMSIATASDLEMAPARPLLMPLLSATACVALADWVIFRWQIGISLVLRLRMACAAASTSDQALPTAPSRSIHGALVAGDLAIL